MNLVVNLSDFKKLYKNCVGQFFGIFLQFKYGFFLQFKHGKPQHKGEILLIIEAQHGAYESA